MKYVDTSVLPGLLFTIPVIKNATDVPDLVAWEHSVQPFLDWLLLILGHLMNDVHSLQDLKFLYLSINPFVSGLGMALLPAPIFFLRSELTGNYSVVDRLWSILPVLFNAHFALWSYWNALNPGRNTALFLCSVIWGIRLTYNFWRKGGYKPGEEDYRWAVLRAKIPRWVFSFFNLTFISTFQVLVLYMITAPAYVILLTSTSVRGEPFGIVDAGFCALLLGIVAFEYIADQQQWDYHRARQVYKKRSRPALDSAYSPADLDRGFLTKGLWAFSRHPNFLAEQSFWVVVYLWSCVVSRTTYNWSGAGVVALLAIFQGSTTLTEAISSEKYPEYQHYRTQVGRFFPSVWSVVRSGYDAPAVLRDGKKYK
ncbi:DUF1295 domain-containing protein [Eremomyces bilateralis CBS 781.70]|uniref:DUF1295 domain-containing protein n=1 Tax=Eremomyces bilateralis CBS 781.70 TaxID=1392243 RepID=A0A6G1GE80_9PEZI|nr:DUF1295 domain-containing protein [Eremomyces bilateralis CBS 781.70]KAF1816190.1 DUF1295 domain-containing protein [Eremomyces bilateralis CBS 781.70]